jgi:hypothetical protein
VLEDLLTFGLIRRPWDRAKIDPAFPVFGYFHERDFEPSKWRGGYSNPAFARAQERDGAWGARIIARFTDEHIRAAVEKGKFSDAKATEELIRILAARRDVIVKRYLTRLSPITDVKVEKDQLCAVDLARRSRLFPRDAFRYTATVLVGERLEKRAGVGAIQLGPTGELCFAIPRLRPDVPGRVDDPSRYTIVHLKNGHAPGALRVHLYDLGPTVGFRLVGLERQNP